MSLYLPHELRWLGYVAGSEWPDGDEDAIWDVSGFWKDAAKALREIDPELQTAKSQAVSAYPQGSGADGVSKMFDQLLTGEQSLDQLADYMDSLGEAAFNMGTQVQAAKLMVIISLIALAIEIAWAWLFPPTAPAQEAASISATQVVVRLLAKLIGERILGTVARVLGEKFLSLAGKFILEIMTSALISGGIDGAVQLGQMADGKRKNFDVKEFGSALAGGAIGGAGGKLFGDFFGKQAGKLFGDMSSPWARNAHGILVGVAGGEFGNVAANVGGGLITGDWSGFTTGAGWAGGGIHGGIGGGVRAYKGGFEGADGIKNFEVPSFGADGKTWGSEKPYGFGEEPPPTTPAGYRGGSENFDTNGPIGGPKLQTPGDTHSGQTNEPVDNRGPGNTPAEGEGSNGQNTPSNTNSPEGQGNSSANGGKSTIPAAGDSGLNGPKSTPTENTGLTNDKPTPIGVSGGGGQDKSTPTDSSGLSNGPKAGSADEQSSVSSSGNQPAAGISSGNNRSNSSGPGLSASGNGDGTVQRPTLSINTDVPQVRDEPVSPLGPGEEGSLTGHESPVSPIDESNPWNSKSSPVPGSSPLSSDPSLSRPTSLSSDPSLNRPASPSTASPIGSGSPTSSTGGPPSRASTSSTSSTGESDPSSPLSASSKGAPSTAPTSPTSSTGSSVRSSPVSTPPSTRAPVSGLGDGSSNPSSSRPGATTGGVQGTGGHTTDDGSGTPASTSTGSQTQASPSGGRDGSGPTNDSPLPPYGSRPHDDSSAPHAGLDSHGLGGHTDGGPVGGSHDEQPPSWERNPDGSITVHLSDGTEVHVQDGFVFVGSHAGLDGGGPAAPHSYGRDGSVRLPRPNGSTVTVKPDGETEVKARGGATTKYEPDGTKIEFGPGGNHTIVTRPDGTVHRVPNDRQGWTKSDDGFTVTSHDGTAHTVDSDGNIVVKHTGDDHGIKISRDGSVGFVDSDGHEMTPAGRPGKGAGQFDQQTFGRPDRVTHTVLPDGGGVRTTGPDGSTTTVKPDGTTEFKTPSGHTITHDPEGMKVEFGPDQSTVVTHADGMSHAVPTDKGSWSKNSEGDILASSPDGTMHKITPGGGPMQVGRAEDDPHRFTVHRPGDSGSEGSPGTVGSIKAKFSDTFGSGTFDEHGVEFHGPGDKSVTIQVSSNGTVKATGSDDSIITVKKNGSAQFVSGDGAKTGFGTGGRESGSKEDWVGNDATWSKQGDDVHMTAPDGTHITVDGEGNIHLSHPGDPNNMIKVTPEHDITFGRPDTTGHTVHPDGTVHTKAPDGTETTVKHDGTTKFEESDGNLTLTKPSGTVVQRSPDGPTVVSGHNGTVQTLEPHGSVKVEESDGTVHTINDAADPRGGRSTKFPDGSTTTVEKAPEGLGLKDQILGLKDQILGDGKPPSVGLHRPDGTDLEVNNKGAMKVSDPNGTTYEKDSKGNVTVTRVTVTRPDGEGGETGSPIESKGGAVKLSNGSTLENTSDGFKVFHNDSVSEVGKGGVKFTDKQGDTRTTRPDGMIGVTKPDGSSRDTRSDGSVRDTKPDGTSEGSRPDGTTWKVDEDNKVHVNEPDGTQRPPADRLSPYLTGDQLVPVKANWSRLEPPATPPGPIDFQAPEAPQADEWLAGDPNLQNSPTTTLPTPSNNWPPPWSDNWNNYPGDQSAGSSGGGQNYTPNLSALRNQEGAALSGLSGMSVPNLSASQLAGLSQLANMPGLSNLGGLSGLSSQALSGLSNVPGLSGMSPSQLSGLSQLSPQQLSALSPSQLSGLSQFSPQQLSALSPSQLSTLSGLSPAQQQALAGLSPQQLASMSPAQLAGLTGLTPAQQATLSPSQLSALAGLSPAQQAALAGMPASELAGLSPSQLSALQGMTPQQLAQLSHLSPQQLANALNAAQAQQGSTGGLGNLAALQQGLNGLTGTNGLSGLGDTLANSANPALSALTNALTGQNSMPSLGAQDMLNSLGNNASGATPGGQGASGGGGSGGSSDSAGGQQDPTAQYGPDAAKSMAAVANGDGASAAGSGNGLTTDHPAQHDPALQDQTSPSSPSQESGGSPGSQGSGGGRPPSEGEGGESSRKRNDRKKKEPTKRAAPKSVLMLSPDEELGADEDEEPGADVDVQFTMGGSSGAQAGSAIKVTPEVVTRMPNGEPPGD